MYFSTIATALLAATGVTLAAPIITSKLETRQSNCPGKITRLYQPQLHNIYHYAGVPQFPSESTVFNIMNGSINKSAQDQVAVWTVPTTASQCFVGWRVTADRSFSVYDNGLVRWSQMSGLPASNVTADSIAPFVKAGTKTASLDFTSWPEVVGEHDHNSGFVDCSVQVSVYLYKDVTIGGTGSVTLEQNDGNGLWLEYCS